MVCPIIEYETENVNSFSGRGETAVNKKELLDRCDNVSTMAGVFSEEKIHQYIQETREFVLPLLRQTKDHWPGESNALFVLKYHICSVIDGLEKCLDAQKNAG